MSLLVAIFINRYLHLNLTIDAMRRMDIIKLKNISEFDPLIGGVTMTFFPINVWLLPFLPFVVIFRSERLSDFILKIQYTYMILLYCLIGALISVPLFPFLYLKSILNGMYIISETKTRTLLDRALNFLHCIQLMLNSVVIIAISLVVDLLKLSTYLLEEEKQFEFKY